MVWQPENEAEKQRFEKLERIRAKGIDPYPGQVRRTHSIAQVRHAYQEVARDIPEGEPTPPLPVIVCGRIVSTIRGNFADLEDGSGRIQIMVSNRHVEPELYKHFQKDVDQFDFLEVEGDVITTKTGEVTVQASSFRLISKTVVQLPTVKERQLDDGTIERYGSFSDPETRFRQRYADLAVNREVRQIFLARARTVSALRRFMEAEGFLEVETPILQPLYGGAAARPFITHHNQLHQDLYLRISFELYLKRLLVGMYDAVFEIGRDFRNEGVSRKHNPEFTQIEWYKAYIDYHGVMDLTERMVAYAAAEVTGGTDIVYQGYAVSLAPPWQRLTLRAAIKQHTGIDYAEYPDADPLRSVMQEKGYNAPPEAKWGELVNNLLDVVEPALVQPTFIIDYPIDISPLAKKKQDDPRHVERFEFFIAGLEMGNAFTELNDPLDQEERFIEMGRLYGADSEEAHPIDEDYLRAMRYGMPPNGGFGMGIDRFVMLLTDQPNIREVILYPALRSRED